MPIADTVLIAAVAAQRAAIADTVAFVHAHPELAHEEQLCAAHLAGRLGDAGLRVEQGVAGLGTAFRAALAGGRAGRRVGIAALYDAVAAVREDGSIEAVHSCGHGLIAGAVVGAALALAPLREQLAGELVVIGCPADEIHSPGTAGRGGGKWMTAAAGVWDDCDVALYAHPEFIDTVSQASLWMRRDTFVVAGTRSLRDDAAQPPIEAIDTLLRAAAEVPRARLMIERLVLDGDVEEGTGLVLTGTLLFFADDEAGIGRTALAVRSALPGAAWRAGRHIPGIRPDARVTAAVADAFAAAGRGFEPDPPPLPFATDFGSISHRVPAALIGVGRPEGWAFHTDEGAAQFASTAGLDVAADIATVLALATARLSEPLLRSEHMAMMFEHLVRVRWRDTDAQGHVNHAVFLTYLEEGRDAFYAQVLGSDPSYVVVRLEVDLRAEVRHLDQQVTVRIQAERLGTTSLTTRETILTSSGDVAADARVVTVRWDPGLRQPIPFDETERTRLAAAMAVQPEPGGGNWTRRLDVQVPAPDGRSHGTLHVPDGDGPWPGVLVFPDAGGARETFRQMGDRLAGMGYVALIPDIYYRAGQWAPFDAATVFTDSQERARLAKLASVLTNDRIIADAGAYADFLLARPEVSGSAIGTTGYCLGGRMSLIAAEGLGRKIAAAASFHGGRLAVAGDPSSPHLSADRITATVYVAGATDDDSFTTEQAGLLQSALSGSGVDYTLEFYPARHGFAVPDNLTYNTEADARHWEALHQLYRTHLQGS